MCTLRGAIGVCVCVCSLIPSPTDHIPEYNGITITKLSTASFNMEPRKMKDIPKQKHVSFHSS